jgi:hypothetical protein
MAETPVSPVASRTAEEPALRKGTEEILEAPSEGLEHPSEFG